MKRRRKPTQKKRSESRNSNKNSLTGIIITIVASCLFFVTLLTKIGVLNEIFRNNGKEITATSDTDQLDIIKSRCLDRIQESNIEVSEQLKKQIAEIGLSDPKHEYSIIADSIIRLVTSEWLNQNNFKNRGEIDSFISNLRQEISLGENAIIVLTEKIKNLESNIEMFEQKRDQYSYLNQNLLAQYNQTIAGKNLELKILKDQLNDKRSETSTLVSNVSKIIKEKNRMKFIELTLAYEINDNFDYDIWSFDEYSSAPRQLRSRFFETLQSGSTNSSAASAKTFEDFDRSFSE